MSRTILRLSHRDRRTARLAAAALLFVATLPGRAAYVPPDDDAYWEAAFPGLDAADTGITSVVIYGDRTYLGGYITSVAGMTVSNVVAWDGRSWSGCAGGLDAGVYSMAPKDAGFYVGGYFRTAGGTPARELARWDGERWLDVGGGTYGGVLALGAYGSNLYVGGDVVEAGGHAVSRVARWDGSRWWSLGAGIIPMVVKGESVGQVRCFAFEGTNVFVGGYFLNAGGTMTKNIARWDGARWHELGKGLRFHDRAGEYDPAVVSALQRHQGKLYAAGYFRLAGEVAATNIACWDGVRWEAVGSGVNDGLGANCLASSGADLYLGGVFKSVGGGAVPHLARWDGQAWHAVGSSGVGQPIGLYCDGSQLLVLGQELVVLGDGTLVRGAAIWHIPRTLKLERAGETVSVSWPSPDSGLALEATGSLTPPNWQPVTQEPALVGARWTVTEALSDAGRFYRLRAAE